LNAIFARCTTRHWTPAGLAGGVRVNSCPGQASANISVVAITDTSPEAQAIQLKIQHEMSGEQRMLLAFETSEFAHELARAGIRKDHPDWPESQVARELLRLAFLPEPLPTWVR
jgi:hypothetical protein